MLVYMALFEEVPFREADDAADASERSHLSSEYK